MTYRQHDAGCLSQVDDEPIRHDWVLAEVADVDELDALELVRTVAAARILMPGSVVRLSAGRVSMSDELQALCLHAGATSIFLGDTLLTAPNADESHDHQLLDRLGSRLAAEPVL